jgi:hypothetical protein
MIGASVPVMAVPLRVKPSASPRVLVKTLETAVVQIVFRMKSALKE